ncbi:uncharacterized protein RAG0_17396 [Rhynchosporium agropyri]|uniref:Uncharacterized protein n=1 Tax=Rhynchosporium agropyri TaxID=914238 RepID=A0A1E1LTR4_9HELO|nr:uncharacterized protein RAG0_17396 [Rhynchosporium agropyri]
MTIFVNIRVIDTSCSLVVLLNRALLDSLLLSYILITLINPSFIIILLLVPASTLSEAYYIHYLRYIRAFLKLKYNNTPVLELLYLFNKLNSKLYKYYSLSNYINIEYIILSGLLLSSETKDIKLNRGSIEFTKKAIFKAIISNTKGKRDLLSSSEIALDLDTPRPSLKKKARRISYYTRSATRATLVDLSKKLDIVVLVPDILDLLEAPETLGEIYLIFNFLVDTTSFRRT